MSEPIRDTETAVRELGALPVPVGTSALTAEQRAAIAELIGDAKPATGRLLEQLAESVRDRREHEHPTWEDLFCLNLVSWAGERMGPVLRRLLDAEVRVAELEARLAEYERPADEDPIRYALTEQAAEDIVHPCGCPKRFDRHAWGCPTLAEDDVSPQVRKLRGILAGQREQATEGKPAVVCRCSEPGSDPYACEADDCTHEFSELNPFGGGSGPVEGHDAKVSRTCGCGWQTSVWHVNDGSAEEELHGHVTRVHGGTAPAAKTGGA